MHALIRIDEVEKEGVAKISDAQGTNVTQINMSRPLSPRDHSGDTD